jgi:primosomal protein N' (replication factor Y)
MIPKAIWEGKIQVPKKVSYHLLNKDASVRGEKQKQVVEALRGGACDESKLKTDAGVSTLTLKTLLKNGIISKTEEPLYKDMSDFTLENTPHHALTPHQTKAIEKILTTGKPILLHGVTGSGKTEIYLRVILDAVSKGRQAIFLVPEIALTPQMIDYFKSYFGAHLAVFHSKLSETKRADEWHKVESGYARLVIGSRSAIFAPVKNLGVIIVDEEHEWTYKQESSPYYQAHHVAELLQSAHQSKLIFGSATPRMETIYHARKGDYEYVELKERVNESEMPKIEIVDLREEFKARHFSVISRKLQREIGKRIEKKEQIILFVNQRGIASAVTCRDCGYTEKCESCEVSMKVHMSGLKCHYCSFQKPLPIVCPSCQSFHIRNIGVGTQRVEEEIKKLFPQARVLRADKDSTSDKEGFEPIYRAFHKREADILIGTQMVAKGLDFEKVTLIGIILADIGLHVPDFRSHEKLFQLITQVAGRCGRGTEVGEVILQTYQPDHFAIKQAASYGYGDFIENELSYREKLSYPPFNHLVKFTVVGPDAVQLEKAVDAEQQILEDIFKVNDLSAKVSSAPALISKMGNRYYYHVLVRLKDPQTLFNHWKVPRGWRVDIDPIQTT